MNCKNHPDRNVVAICQKYNIGYCDICCECNDDNSCCECSDPELYCRFRSQCIIWEICKQRRKKKGKIEKIKQEVEKLKQQLSDRKTALPMHGATPAQWLEVEDIEEKLALKKKELRQLETDLGVGQ